MQKEIIESDAERIVVLSRAASGKALRNDSKLYTSNGFIQIGNVNIGDKIFGEDGKLHTVTAVYPQGRKQEYKVTFSDNTSVICCEDHLWTFQTENLRSHKSKKWITCSLKEILEKYPIYISARANNNFGDTASKRKNLFIPMTAPIEFKEQKVLLDPYTMGVLLGDGSFRGSKFTNEDADIIEWVESGLNKVNCKLIYSKNYDYSINSNGKQIFSKILKEYNLWNLKSEDKFIPNVYKYNSIENRLALLQGLIDTDGYCEGSAYDICLKSKQLILDCKEICESLGLTAVYSEKRAVCTNSPDGKKDCGIVYRLRIKTSKLIPKIHRSKKRENQWKPTKVYSHRAIVNIEKLESESEMTCITVDNPTALFVTDNFIVTHNTAVLTERARHLLQQGVDPKEIAVITFTNLAAQELRQRLAEDYKDGIFIGTIHSLAYNMLVSHGINCDDLINKEKFDDFFTRLEENSYCVRHYSYVLLDEAQDSSDKEFNFIFGMIEPENFFIVGDDFQSIYSFRNAKPQLLINLSRRADVKTYVMNENYRNAPQILDVARLIIKKNDIYDDSIAMRDTYGIYESFVYSPENLVKRIKKYGSYKDWSILTRSNAQVAMIQQDLERYGIPTLTFKQGDVSQEELKNFLDADKVKVLTIHSSKGLSLRYVGVYGAWWGKKEEHRLNYVAATRAMDGLFWMKEPKKNMKKNWF